MLNASRAYPTVTTTTAQQLFESLGALGLDEDQCADAFVELLESGQIRLAGATEGSLSRRLGLEPRQN